MSIYMQCTNFDRDLVFLNIVTESLHWVLPEDASFLDVIFVAHQSAADKYYYEYLRTSETTWVLPTSVEGYEISPSLNEVIVALGAMVREDIEDISGERFDDDAVNEQRDLFLDYLDHKDDPRYSHRISMSKLSQLGISAYNLVHSNTILQSTSMPATSSSSAASATAASNADIQIKQKEAQEDLDLIPDSIVVKNGQGVLEVAVVKKGYLTKLASQSMAGWQKRYVVLTALSLMYYQQDKQYQQDSQSCRGELMLGSDLQVEDDSASSLAFKVGNMTESYIFAASNAEEKQSWMKALQVNIAEAAAFKRSYGYLISSSTNPTAVSDELKYYFIYGNHGLTCHQDYKCISKLIAAIEIDEYATVEVLDDEQRVLSCTDSDQRQLTMKFKESSLSKDLKQYQQWKEAMLKETKSTGKVRSASNAATSSAQPMPPPPRMDRQESIASTTTTSSSVAASATSTSMMSPTSKALNSLFGFASSKSNTNPPPPQQVAIEPEPEITEEQIANGKVNALQMAKLRKKSKVDPSYTLPTLSSENNTVMNTKKANNSQDVNPEVDKLLTGFKSYSKSSLVALSQYIDEHSDDEDYNIIKRRQSLKPFLNSNEEATQPAPPAPPSSSSSIANDSPTKKSNALEAAATRRQSGKILINDLPQQPIPTSVAPPPPSSLNPPPGPPNAKPSPPDSNTAPFPPKPPAIAQPVTAVAPPVSVVPPSKVPPPSVAPPVNVVPPPKAVPPPSVAPPVNVVPPPKAVPPPTVISSNPIDQDMANKIKPTDKHISTKTTSNAQKALKNKQMKKDKQRSNSFSSVSSSNTTASRSGLSTGKPDLEHPGNDLDADWMLSQLDMDAMHQSVDAQSTEEFASPTTKSLQALFGLSNDRKTPSPPVIEDDMLAALDMTPPPPPTVHKTHPREEDVLAGIEVDLSFHEETVPLAPSKATNIPFSNQKVTNDEENIKSVEKKPKNALEAVAARKSMKKSGIVPDAAPATAPATAPAIVPTPPSFISNPLASATPSKYQEPIDDMLSSPPPPPPMMIKTAETVQTSNPIPQKPPVLASPPPFQFPSNDMSPLNSPEGDGSGNALKMAAMRKERRKSVVSTGTLPSMNLPVSLPIGSKPFATFSTPTKIVSNNADNSMDCKSSNSNKPQESSNSVKANNFRGFYGSDDFNDDEDEEDQKKPTSFRISSSKRRQSVMAASKSKSTPAPPPAVASKPSVPKPQIRHHQMDTNVDNDNDEDDDAREFQKIPQTSTSTSVPFASTRTTTNTTQQLYRDDRYDDDESDQDGEGNIFKQSRPSSHKVRMSDLAQISQDRDAYNDDTNAMTHRRLSKHHEILQQQPPPQQAFVPIDPNLTYYANQQQAMGAPSGGYQNYPSPSGYQSSGGGGYSSGGSGSHFSGNELFQKMQNKPLVKIFFENYSTPLDTYSAMMYPQMYPPSFYVVTSELLQKLCYELGNFLTEEDIEKVMMTYSSKQEIHQESKHIQYYLTYEDFLVYWRSHPIYSNMKLMDPKVKRRINVASIFSDFDILTHGYLKIAQFTKFYETLGEQDLLPTKKFKLDDVIKKLDPNRRGKVDMNKFMEWMDNNVPITTNRISTFGKIFSALLPKRSGTPNSEGSKGSTTAGNNNDQQSIGSAGSQMSQRNRANRASILIAAKQNKKGFGFQNNSNSTPSAALSHSPMPWTSANSSPQDLNFQMTPSHQYSTSPTITRASPRPSVQSHYSDADSMMSSPPPPPPLSTTSSPSMAVSSNSNKDQYASRRKSRLPSAPYPIELKAENHSDAVMTMKPNASFVPVGNEPNPEEAEVDLESVGVADVDADRSKIKKPVKGMLARRKSVMKTSIPSSSGKAMNGSDTSNAFPVTNSQPSVSMSFASSDVTVEDFQPNKPMANNPVVSVQPPPVAINRGADSNNSDNPLMAMMKKKDTTTASNPIADIADRAASQTSKKPPGVLKKKFTGKSASSSSAATAGTTTTAAVSKAGPVEDSNPNKPVIDLPPVSLNTMMELKKQGFANIKVNSVASSSSSDQVSSWTASPAQTQSTANTQQPHPTSTALFTPSKVKKLGLYVTTNSPDSDRDEETLVTSPLQSTMTSMYHSYAQKKPLVLSTLLPPSKPQNVGVEEPAHMSKSEQYADPKLSLADLQPSPVADPVVPKKPTMTYATLLQDEIRTELMHEDRSTFQKAIKDLIEEVANHVGCTLPSQGLSAAEEPTNQNDTKSMNSYQQSVQDRHMMLDAVQWVHRLQQQSQQRILQVQLQSQQRIFQHAQELSTSSIPSMHQKTMIMHQAFLDELEDGKCELKNKIGQLEELQAAIKVKHENHVNTLDQLVEQLEIKRQDLLQAKTELYNKTLPRLVMISQDVEDIKPYAARLHEYPNIYGNHPTRLSSVELLGVTRPLAPQHPYLSSSSKTSIPTIGSELPPRPQPPSYSRAHRNVVASVEPPQQSQPQTMLPKEKDYFSDDDTQIYGLSSEKRLVSYPEPQVSSYQQYSLAPVPISTAVQVPYTLASNSMDSFAQAYMTSDDDMSVHSSTSKLSKLWNHADNSSRDVRDNPIGGRGIAAVEEEKSTHPMESKLSKLLAKLQQ